MMYKKIEEMVVKNLTKNEDLGELSVLIHRLLMSLTNSKIIFNLCLTNPFSQVPVKNQFCGEKTSNLIYKYIDTQNVPLDNVLIILSCDVFYNARNNNFDVGIFSNGYNLCYKIANETSEYFCEKYRITACGFKIKAANINCCIKKLKNLPSGLISNTERITNDSEFRYFKNQYFISEKYDLSIINEPNLKNNDIYYFPYVNTSFLANEEVPNESYYFLISCTNYSCLSFIKHVEQIPNSEYYQIFNNDINENVW